jgi:hypothetical protein
MAGCLRKDPGQGDLLPLPAGQVLAHAADLEIKPLLDDALQDPLLDQQLHQVLIDALQRPAATGPWAGRRGYCRGCCGLEYTVRAS